MQQSMHRRLVDEPEHVRPRHEPEREVTRKMRQPQRFQELAREQQIKN